MKKFWFFLFVVVFLFPVFAYSQENNVDEPKEAQTKIEELLLKKGILTVTSYYYLSEFRADESENKGYRVKFDAVVVSSPSSDGIILKGIRLEVTTVEIIGGRVLKKTVNSFLDYDEAESLSSALVVMIRMADEMDDSADSGDKEVAYSTSGRVKIGFKRENKDFLAFVKDGVSDEFYIEIGTLGAIKDIIDSGIAILNQK